MVASCRISDRHREYNSKGVIVVSCVFCGIVSRTVPARIIYENEHVCAFHDIAPMAPTHIVIIPKRHIVRVDAPEAEEYASHIFAAVREIARTEGLSEDGFRVVTNTGKQGGQTVDHLHFHLIGGRPLEGFLG